MAHERRLFVYKARSLSDDVRWGAEWTTVWEQSHDKLRSVGAEDRIIDFSVRTDTVTLKREVSLEIETADHGVVQFIEPADVFPSDALLAQIMLVV